MKNEVRRITGRKGVSIFFHSLAVITLAVCIFLLNACGSFLSANSVEYFFEKKPYEESYLLGSQLLEDLNIACEVQEGVAALYNEKGELRSGEQLGYIYLTSEQKDIHITLKDVLLSAYFLERIRGIGQPTEENEEESVDRDNGTMEDIVELLSNRYGFSAGLEEWAEEQIKYGIPEDTEFLRWLKKRQVETGGVFGISDTVYREEIFVLRQDADEVEEDSPVDISDIMYTTSLGTYLETQISAVAEKLQYMQYHNEFNADSTNFRYVIADLRNPEKTVGNCEKIETPLFQAVIAGENSEVQINGFAGRISDREWLSVLRSKELYGGEFIVTVGKVSSYEVWDIYSFNHEIYDIFLHFLPVILILLLISGLVWLATLIFMVCWAGHKDRSGEIQLIFLDRWYLEIVTLAAAASFFLLLDALDTSAFYGHWSYGWTMIWEFAFVALLLGGVYLLGMLYLFSVIRRAKAGLLWKTTFAAALLGWVDSLRKEAIRFIVGGSNRSKKVLAFYCLWLLGNIFALLIIWAGYEMSHYGGQGWLAVVSIVLFLAWLWLQWRVIRLLTAKTHQQELLGRAVEEIRSGNLEYQVEGEAFFEPEKKMADGINHIGEGLHAAVDTAMKSERMKTDLITNVSHDIKTPLTSIINYVDLLKREDIPGEKARQYLEVLDKKSQRLKNLTEDLVEASKASSGNLKLELMRLDFVELVKQVNGEFRERLESRQLTLVEQLPEGGAVIIADGRRLWRVLENLYGNAAKYAMPGTRVYVEVVRTDTRVSFSMKNISEAPLNISPDELTERFTRGDASRSTEGSGLGLSIARSLTELQKGTFEIYLDGDLFRATVSFPLAPEHR